MPSLITTLKTAISRGQSLRRLIAKEREYAGTLDGPARCALWRKGFLSEAALIYDFARNDLREYLPDFHRFVLAPKINRPSARLLSDKLLFMAVVGRHLPVTPLLAVIQHGGLLAAAREPWIDDVDALIEHVEREGTAVIKPSGGGGGSGILLLARRDDGGLTLNLEPIIAATLRRRIVALDQHVVTGFVRQANYARTIYPDTSNTIRVVTMIDPETGDPFILVAVQRFGTVASWPVDNWTRGGVSVFVDPESGVMGRGATYPRGDAMEWIERHPDSGERFTGLAIPGWDEIRWRLLEFVRRHPEFKYVGWDVIVTDDGFTVVEGNDNTDINLLQIHGGFLRDPRARAFLRREGVLRR